jgi:TIR domain/Putative peptidoglycan binding domain
VSTGELGPSALPGHTDEAASGSLRLFWSYAHEDDQMRRELHTHLAPLRNEQLLVDWSDRDITPGTDWDTEISARLSSSNIVLVLVSADFLASSYAYGKELRRALELHDSGVLTVVPVILRPSLWRNLPIGRLQALPQDARPISTWEDRDSAYLSVVEGLATLARELSATSHTLLADWITSRLLRLEVIRTVQRHLAERQLYTGPIDGIPGPMTEHAVRALQRTGGKRVDGKIGPDVIQLLTSFPVGVDATEGVGP